MKQNIEKSFGLQTMSSEMKNAINYHNWLFAKTKPYLGQRILEIGIGDGSYTQHIVDKQLVVGIDIAEDCIQFCSKKFINYQNIECFRVDILNDDINFLKYKNLDSAFCFNVLEHIKDDISFLKKIKSVISYNGHLVLVVPATSFLYGEMDRLAGHYRRYNIQSIKRISREAGWVVKKIEYINFLGGIGWWLSNIMTKPKTLNDISINKKILFFDKFILPFNKIFDFFAKNFFGQSLIIILENKE